MRELVFVLTFRGTAAADPAAPHRRRARSTAPSQTLRTRITGDAIESSGEPTDGATAVLESEVERLSDGTFIEWGTITYGEVGSVTFETSGRGVVADSAVPGWKSGTVTWRVTRGTGRLAGATGTIASSFTVSDAGDVVDHHVARFWLADR